MGTEVALKGKNDIDVIKNRIYEVRAFIRSQFATLYGGKCNLKSQFVTSSLEKADNETNLMPQIATSSPRKRIGFKQSKK